MFDRRVNEEEEDDILKKKDEGEDERSGRREKVGEGVSREEFKEKFSEESIKVHAGVSVSEVHELKACNSGVPLSFKFPSKKIPLPVQVSEEERERLKEERIE